MNSGCDHTTRDPGEFDSELERRFATQFEQVETEWTLERETDIINLKDTVMIPRFRVLASRRAAGVDGDRRILDAGLPPEEAMETETGGHAQHDHRCVGAVELFG